MKKEIKLLTGIAAGVVLGAGIAQTTNVFADDEVVATPEEVVEQSNENVKEFSEDAVIEEEKEEVTEDEAVVTDTEEEIAVEEEATTTTVAKIGETEYSSLNEAISAAQEQGGATISLLESCELDVNNAIEIVKNVIIEGTGSQTISMKAENWPGDHFVEVKTGDITKGLTLRNCTLEAKNLPASTYNYNAYFRINGGMVTLDNATMELDGTLADGSKNNCHGFWTLENGDNAINVTNKSTLYIHNFKHNSIEWDGTTRNELNVLNGSKYISENTRGAVIGTWEVTAVDSEMIWTNHSTSGSNGSNFYLTNSKLSSENALAHGISANIFQATNSTVIAKNNAYYGLCATTNDIVNSTIETTNNGYNGYLARQTFNVKNSKITVDNNGYYAENDTYAGLQFGTTGRTPFECSGNVDEDSTLIVTNNAGNGIRLKNASSITINAKKFVVMYNQSSAKGDNGTGGGINVQKGYLIVPATAEIYNNHADTAGDDIHVASGASISFGSVGSDWILNDCNHLINGWYDDAAGTRWAADVAKEARHIELVDAGVLRGEIALKAAHGVITYNVIVNYVDEDGNVIDKQVVVKEVDSFDGYDVTEYDKKDIDGYTYSKTEGTLVKEGGEQIDTDQIVNVIYKKNVTPTPVTPSNTTTNGTSTGVETDVMMYVGSASVAALGAVSTTLKRRKDLKRVNKNKDLYR